MWSWMGYPPMPGNAPVPEPVLARLAVSKAEWMHGLETFHRMSVDMGRTEGATVVIVVVMALAFLALLGGAAFRAAGAFFVWLARR